MAAVAVDVCEEVKTVIDAATLSQNFTPERNYADWERELTDLGTLAVDVCLVTTKQEANAETRGRLITYTELIDVVVRKKLTRDSTTGKIPNTQIDPLVLLVEEINELFILKRLTGYPSGVQQGESKIVQSPIPRDLRELTQFTGIIRIPFEATKQL